MGLHLVDIYAIFAEPVIEREWECGKAEVWKLLLDNKKSFLTQTQKETDIFWTSEEVLKGGRNGNNFHFHLWGICSFFNCWEQKNSWLRSPVKLGQAPASDMCSLCIFFSLWTIPSESTVSTPVIWKHPKCISLALDFAKLQIQYIYTAYRTTLVKSH